MNEVVFWIAVGYVGGIFVNLLLNENRYIHEKLMPIILGIDGR